MARRRLHQRHRQRTHPSPQAATSSPAPASDDARFVTLIHPLAAVSRRAKIGNGSCIGPNCAVSGQVEIGAHAWLGSHAVIGHECMLGAGADGGAFRHAGRWRDARRPGLHRVRRRAATRHYRGRRCLGRHGRRRAQGCASPVSSSSAIRPGGLPPTARSGLPAQMHHDRIGSMSAGAR